MQRLPLYAVRHTPECFIADHVRLRPVICDEALRRMPNCIQGEPLHSAPLGDAQGFRFLDSMSEPLARKLL